MKIDNLYFLYSNWLFVYLYLVMNFHICFSYLFILCVMYRQQLRNQRQFSSHNVEMNNKGILFYSFIYLFIYLHIP